MKKLMYLIGLLSSISIGLGWLFHVLNWTGASQLLNYGLLGFLLLFSPMLAYERYKQGLRHAIREKLTIIFAVVSASAVAIALVLKTLHLTGADMMLTAGMLIFTGGFLPCLFFNMYRKSVSVRLKQ